MTNTTSTRDPGLRVQGVLLDIDGTLVDSNDAHAQAWVKAFQREGLDVGFDEVREAIGMGGDKLVTVLVGPDEDARLGDRLREARTVIFRDEYLPNLKPMRGARELVAMLRAEGFRVGVATSAKRTELDPLLEIAGVAALVREGSRTSADDAEHSKPDPDIVEAALARIGVPPERTVMLGDTPYDVEAARRAGVRCIALRCGGWRDDRLKGAAAIYDDPADLVARFATSVLAER